MGTIELLNNQTIKQLLLAISPRSNCHHEQSKCQKYQASVQRQVPRRSFIKQAIEK